MPERQPRWMLAPESITPAMEDAAMRETTACGEDYLDEDARRDMRVGYAAAIGAIVVLIDDQTIKRLISAAKRAECASKGWPTEAATRFECAWVKRLFAAAQEGEKPARPSPGAVASDGEQA